VHVPAEALELRASGKPLVITEGELKATAATALSGRPVVSIPGVGNWRRGVELARAWGSPVVVVAFDADARTNPDVARHQRDLLRALAAEGFDARLWQWPPEAGRGLDDVLLARRDARLATNGTDPR
jgi:DNA primase